MAIALIVGREGDHIGSKPRPGEAQHVKIVFTIDEMCWFILKLEPDQAETFGRQIVGEASAAKGQLVIPGLAGMIPPTSKEQ